MDLVPVCSPTPEAPRRLLRSSHCLSLSRVRPLRNKTLGPLLDWADRPASFPPLLLRF
jgi:hypothetical protein